MHTNGHCRVNNVEEVVFASKDYLNNIIITIYSILLVLSVAQAPGRLDKNSRHDYQSRIWKVGSFCQLSSEIETIFFNAKS